jgi:hypothetical protein
MPIKTQIFKHGKEIGPFFRLAALTAALAVNLQRGGWGIYAQLAREALY